MTIVSIRLTCKYKSISITQCYQRSTRNESYHHANGIEMESNETYSSSLVGLSHEPLLDLIINQQCWVSVFGHPKWIILVVTHLIFRGLVIECFIITYASAVEIIESSLKGEEIERNICNFENFSIWFFGIQQIDIHDRAYWWDTRCRWSKSEWLSIHWVYAGSILSIASSAKFIVAKHHRMNGIIFLLAPLW